MPVLQWITSSFTWESPGMSLWSKTKMCLNLMFISSLMYFPLLWVAIVKALMWVLRHFKKKKNLYQNYGKNVKEQYLTLLCDTSNWNWKGSCLGKEIYVAHQVFIQLYKGIIRKKTHVHNVKLTFPWYQKKSTHYEGFWNSPLVWKSLQNHKLDQLTSLLVDRN